MNTKNISIPKNAHFKLCSGCIISMMCSEQCEPVTNFVKNFVEEWRNLNGRNEFRGASNTEHSGGETLSRRTSGKFLSSKFR